MLLQDRAMEVSPRIDKAFCQVFKRDAADQSPLATSVSTPVILFSDRTSQQDVPVIYLTGITSGNLVFCESGSDLIKLLLVSSSLSALMTAIPLVTLLHEGTHYVGPSQG